MTNKEDYFALDAVSNSSLSWILPESGGSVKKYEANKLFPPEDLDSAEAELGTNAHLLVETGTLDSFEVVNKPGPSVSAICEEVVNHPAYGAMSHVQINDEIVRVARANDFQPRWGDDAILKNILKDGGDYMKALTTSTKKLVDEETMSKLNSIKISLDETAPWLFDDKVLPPGCDPEDEFEVLREEMIIFTIDDIPCKALIDILVINHTKKAIDIYDLKTVSMPLSIYLGYEMDGEKVEGVFMKRSVNRQLAFYMLASNSLPSGYYDITTNIIACETKGVFESQIYFLNADQMSKGLNRIRYGINLLNENNLVSMGGL